MRYLWLITIVIVAAGALLVLAGLTGAASPIALIGGLLLLWSGVVKVIVLRIWRFVLPHGARGDDRIPDERSAEPLGRTL